MGELSDAERDRILTPFLREYNAVHGSSYVFREAQPQDDRSCDFLCTDATRSKEPLKIQHTVAGREDLRERRLPGHRERVGREVLRLLRRNDSRGIMVTLDVQQPPEAREEQRKLAYAIWMVIREALEEDPGRPRAPLLLGFDRLQYEGFLDRLRPAVSRLEVRRLDRPEVPALLTFQCIEAGPTPLTAAERVREAVDRKALAGKAGGSDVVLLVHLDLWPYDEELDLPEIVRVVETHNPGFKEVWIVDDCELPKPQARRVWTRVD